MLLVHAPSTRRAEREYVVGVLLGEFLGLDFEFRVDDGPDTRITLADDAEDRSVSVLDGLFAVADEDWLAETSLPERPLQHWHPGDELLDTPLVGADLPVPYGTRLTGARLCEVAPGRIRFGLDLFGSAFFFLTRYEEAVSPERDAHERFPATAGIALKEGFLERPVVNEYVELLWAALARTWPSLERRTRTGRVLLGHDVDIPLGTAGKNAPALITSCVADVVRRRDPGLSARRLKAAFRARRGEHDDDPYNTFDLIMDESERRSIPSTFHFVCGRTDDRFDPAYDVGDRWIRSLIRRIRERGHEIGLHPSYDTYLDGAQLRSEFDRLRNVAADEGVHQAEWGSRQHFLRWQNPTTWRILDECGIAYDSTLSFADHVGFRCGVCYEYPVFDLERRRALALRERPLIVMDGTVLERKYMGMGGDEAVRSIVYLQRTCARFDGDFTLLWHNSMLVTARQRELYRQVLDGITA